MHPHVEQRSNQLVGTRRYQELRIHAKPVFLEHCSESRPNRLLIVDRGIQFAEMNPAAQSPVGLRLAPPHHSSMAAHGGAIVKPGWIRGIRPKLCFEECRSKIAPIDA